MMMKIQRYEIGLIYTPSKQLILADALSRAPVKYYVIMTEQNVQIHMNMMSATLPVSNTKTSRL